MTHIEAFNEISEVKSYDLINPRLGTDNYHLAATAIKCMQLDGFHAEMIRYSFQLSRERLLELIKYSKQTLVMSAIKQRVNKRKVADYDFDTAEEFVKNLLSKK